MICSAEDVGFYVVNELHITQRSYVVIDIDKTKIERALKVFPELLSVEGDATDSETLQKAGIHDAAGLFAVTGDDNQNLVISLTAKQTNPNIRIIAKCNDVKN